MTGFPEQSTWYAMPYNGGEYAFTDPFSAYSKLDELDVVGDIHLFSIRSGTREVAASRYDDGSWAVAEERPDLPFPGEQGIWYFAEGDYSILRFKTDPAVNAYVDAEIWRPSTGVWVTYPGWTGIGFRVTSGDDNYWPLHESVVPVMMRDYRASEADSELSYWEMREKDTTQFPTWYAVPADGSGDVSFVIAFEAYGELEELDVEGNVELLSAATGLRTVSAHRTADGTWTIPDEKHYRTAIDPSENGDEDETDDKVRQVPTFGRGTRLHQGVVTGDPVSGYDHDYNEYVHYSEDGLEVSTHDGGHWPVDELHTALWVEPEDVPDLLLALGAQSGDDPAELLVRQIQKEVLPGGRVSYNRISLWLKQHGVPYTSASKNVSNL
jgi:hypothetical protein